MGFWNIFFGKKKKENSQKQSPFLPKKRDPIEILFAKNFTRKGGKFIFCENPEDTDKYFNDILFENNWSEKEVYCINETLNSRFNIKNNSLNKNPSDYSVFLINCEYLIANKGSILICNKQLKNFKLDKLPISLIVFSSINQFANDVSEGMTKLKNKYSRKLPSNITTLKPKKLIEENNFLSSGNSAKNIYLLLQDE